MEFVLSYLVLLITRWFCIVLLCNVKGLSLFVFFAALIKGSLLWTCLWEFVFLYTCVFNAFSSKLLCLSFAHVFTMYVLIRVSAVFKVFSSWFLCSPFKCSYVCLCFVQGFSSWLLCSPLPPFRVQSSMVQQVS